MSLQAMKWVFDTLKINGLGPTERAVLFFLCYRHNYKTGDCFPAMATIAEHAGVSERRARTAVRILEDRGLIRSNRRCGQAGNSSNQYTLLVLTEEGQTGTKKKGETGTPVPILVRQTVADDKGSYFQGGKQRLLARTKKNGGYVYA